MSANQDGHHEAADARRRKEPMPASLPLQRGALALLVDDQSYARHRGREALRQLGFEVIALDSGAEALSLLPSLGERLSCAVLDLSLSRMEGAALVAGIRAARPGLPLLLGCGEATRGQLAALPPDPLTAVLPKPYRGEAIAALLWRLLGFAPARPQA